MPIPFSLIPEHIQISVTEKLEWRNFPKFVMSSRNAYEISQKIRTKIVIRDSAIYVYEVNRTMNLSCFNRKMRKTLDASLEIFLDFPFRFFGFMKFNQEITNEICEQFLKYLCISKSRFGHLQISQPVTCSLKQFNALLELSGATKLYCYANKSRYFTVEGINHLEHFTCVSNFNDEQFLSLKIPSMSIYLTEVTSHGINIFLKEWLNGERRIACVRIKTSRAIYFDVVLEGIPHIVRELPSGTFYILEIGNHQISVNCDKNEDLVIEKMNPH